MTRDELLVLLIEEAGEVIQAATKCLRFGFTREWPDYGVNHEVLAKEVGEFIAVAEALGLSFSIINLAKAKKLDRAEFWKKIFLGTSDQMKSSITEGGIFIGDYVTALFRWFVLFLIATAIWFPIRIYLEIP